MRVVLIIVKITHFRTVRKEKQNSYIALGINVDQCEKQNTQIYCKLYRMSFTGNKN